MHFLKHIRFSEYRTLIYRLFLVYLFYFLARATFVLFNADHLTVGGFSGFFRLAFYGLLFDTTAIIYVNMLFILLSIIPAIINTSKGYQRLLFWVYFLTNIAAYLLCFIDIAFFDYNKTRLTWGATAIVENEHNLTPIIIGLLVKYWSVFALFVIYCIFWVFFYRLKRQRIVGIAQCKPYFISSAVVIVLLTPALVWGIRGFSFKTGVVPLTVMDANKYANDVSQVNVLLNTPFSLIRTIGKDKGFREYHFTDEKYITEHIKPMKQYHREVHKKPNIVLIILEGIGAEYVGVLNEHTGIAGYRGHTPFLDSLAQQGFYFTNIYANSSHSIEGIPAITAGIPTFESTFMNSGYAQRRLSSLANISRELGYQTLFAHGATNGSMNFDGFTRQAGYERYLGRTEFNDERYYNGSWGIDDEPFLQYFAKNIDQMHSPFLATVFLLSSHGPYTVPEPYKNRFNKGDIPMHNVVEYSDYSIGQFFKTIKKAPWYKHTIFAIISDHTTEDYYDYYKQPIAHHREPIILFSPNKTLIPQGCSDVLGQQIDIFPTLVDLMGYHKPFRSWGRSLLSDSGEMPRAYITNTNFYQLMQGNYIYLLDPTGKVAGIYNKDDFSLSNDLKTQPLNEEQRTGIADMRAFMQDFMDRIINDKMR